MSYLMIQNRGVAPVAGYTTLGVSTTRLDSSQHTIGQFGSGAKHSIGLLLRNEINPIVFCGNLRLEFETAPMNVDDGITSHQYSQVVVNLSGKDENNKTVRRTEKLGFTLEFGVYDWSDCQMAVREFVSNAIDRTARNKEHDLDYDKLRSEGLVIEIVENNQVRAKTGHTRVFIPLSADIEDAYRDLRWKFLVFGNTKEIGQQVLRKARRGIKADEVDSATIFKKGVFVTKFPNNVPSLFDYNLGDEIQLDESRNTSVDSLIPACLRAICNDTPRNKLELLQAIVTNREVLETKHTWHLYSVTNTNQGWQDIWKTAYGKNAVWCLAESTTLVDLVKRRGYTPIPIPGRFSESMRSMGIPSYLDVLEKMEARGCEPTQPSQNMVSCRDKVWEWALAFDLTNNKAKPEIMGFNYQMKAESMVRGYQSGDTIYINNEIDSDSIDMMKTVVEEIAHYITGATDMSRDFQEFLITWIVKAFN